MSAALNIRVLGPLEVERSDGSRIALPPMQRRLLCALVIADGSTVSYGQLVRSLWGESAPASARNSLQSHATRLRAALGPSEIVRTRPGGYLLDPDAVVVDAREFTVAVRRARSASTNDPAATVAELDAALASWRGDPYGELSDDFAADEATRLRELEREARVLLAQAHRRSGDVDGAIEVLTGLVAREPLHEPSVLALAASLGTAGRVPDALAVIERHRHRLADELGLDPSPRLSGLQQALLRGDLAEPTPSPRPVTRPSAPTGPADPATAPTAVPARPPVAPPRRGTPTRGRDRDRDRVLDALDAAQLVTLVGAGGIGKTRLAALVGDGVDRACWLDLAPLRSAEDLPATALEALGWTVPGPGARHATAVEALAQHGGLVVLDNCEHLLDAVSGLLDDVLARDGATRLLATSRERLDLPGERVVSLGPLAVPSPDAASAADPAVQLVNDQVVAAGGAPLDPADAAAIVAAVDGLPLAIELAAARAAVLPVPALLDSLREGLGILAGTGRRYGDRHHTITAVLDWSHHLLEPSAQTLFRRLAVFTATFTPDDARAVAIDEQLADGWVAPALARLVETSMVVRDTDARYRLLEPLRLYAAERLEEAGETAPTSRRHRDLLLALAARADAQVSGPAETAVMAEIEHALPDLRAVHARALADDDLATVAALAGRLYRFAYLQARPDVLGWGHPIADLDDLDELDADTAGRAVAVVASAAFMTGDLDRAGRLAARATELVTDPWSRLTVTEVTGDLHVASGDLDAARAAYRDNLALAEELGSEALAAQGEAGLALTLDYAGEDDDALARARRAVARSERRAGPSVQALVSYTLGEVLADRDPDRALQAFGRAIELATAARAPFYEGLARTADVALRSRHGEPEAALTRYREAIALWRDRHAHGPLATALRNLVVLLARVGADRETLALHAAIDLLADKPTFGPEADRLAEAAALAGARLDPEAVATARAAGAALGDLHEAASAALAMVEDLLAEPAPPAGPRATP